MGIGVAAISCRRSAVEWKSSGRTYSRFHEHEPHMRAALQLALEHQSLEAAGLLEEEPFRRGRQRTEILATTIAPLKQKLSMMDALVDAALDEREQPVKVEPISSTGRRVR